MFLNSNRALNRVSWNKLIVLVLTFWLSSSLILDLVIMPSLYASGMMNPSEFATAGYSMFWAFNRVELVCAAVVLTSMLSLYQPVAQGQSMSYGDIAVAALLLSIALLYTYVLAPQMSALGLQLDLWTTATMTPAMNQMHQSYWALEVGKLIGGVWLINRFYR